MDGRARAWGIAAFLLLLPQVGAAQPANLSSYVIFADEQVTIGGGASIGNGNSGSHVGTNGTLSAGRATLSSGGASFVGDVVRVAPESNINGPVYYNTARIAIGTAYLLQRGVPIPFLVLAPPPVITPSSTNRSFQPPDVMSLPPGAYGKISVRAGVPIVLHGDYDFEEFVVRGNPQASTPITCDNPSGCTVRVRSRFAVTANPIGETGTPIVFVYGGRRGISLGLAGGRVKASLYAPLGSVKLRSSKHAPLSYTGNLVGRVVKVGAAATLLGGPTVVCGNGVVEHPEVCDPPHDEACPGACRTDCTCTLPGSPAVLHAVGPTVLHNATSFGLQLFGEDFLPGATVQLQDKASGAVLATLPATVTSNREMTIVVPAGLAVPSGIERELTARVVNPGAAASNAPDIGSCNTDKPASPIACTADTDCPFGTGPCITGKQRLTLFNDLAFRNPSSAALIPAPHGLCDDNSRCQSAAACAGIGSGQCSPKLYVTPQQQDEVWVFNTGTQQFADQSAAAGIQGIPVGDNPFHVQVLNLGGGLARAWVVDRFDDAISIIDPATDTEIVRLTGAMLGVPGRLRMETEIEFNRAGTRAYLSNENLDEVQVLDIAGAHLDAPVLLTAIDVGVNPRGMVTNATDTRLYVANIQSADVSVVDITPGSPTENQVLRTVAARATDDIVGGRADGWEPFVISGRAPRGIVYSDALGMLFITSIGPQTGPRQGVVQTGGAVINPTVTVIDAATDTVVAHVALELMNPDRFSCTDPELMALDDARGRLYVTCQGSGTVDVLDTAALAAGVPAEIGIVALPLPVDAAVPTLTLPSATGTFGQKVCAAFTSNRGAACTSNSDCGGCPTLVEGLPVTCCQVNNPVGLHNGPRGVALADDGQTLYVVNQFTTSVAAVDVSPLDPSFITTIGVTSYPDAFGGNTAQRDRRLGQIEFFTDVKKTGVSCATCHIDDHQDGVFFEADVRGPRLRRVLSVRGTRDTPPLLQDQLVPDLTSFTDIVVHAERGGAVPCTPCLEISGVFQCFGNASNDCFMTSNTENKDNALYSKAITFFPNPNLTPTGAFSTTVPLPGGLTGDAVRGATLFGQLACQQCHPAPLFTIDQLHSFDVSGLGQPVRMRDVSTPVLIPLRQKCQDPSRPVGGDGSTGFTVPTLRGVWDTFPLLLSGSAGLSAVGAEPAFAPGCAVGSSGCCAQLKSPLNPSGITVPPQHLAVSTKDALRAVLTPPLAVPGSGHGAALGLSASDLNALIAYIRSL